MIAFAVVLQSIIRWVKNLDWVSVITGGIIPVIIMFWTLHSEKKRHLEALAEQKAEHNREMLEQKKTTQLAVMPIFDAVSFKGSYETTGYLSGSSQRKHVLEITLKNVGGGNAFGLVTKISQCDKGNILKFVDSSNTAIYTCYKDFQFDNAIATVGKEVTVLIIRKGKDKAACPEDIFILPIRYIDMLGNYYEQRIAFQFVINQEDGSVMLTTIKPGIPEQIESNTPMHY